MAARAYSEISRTHPSWVMTSLGAPRQRSWGTASPADERRRSRRAHHAPARPRHHPSEAGRLGVRRAQPDQACPEVPVPQGRDTVRRGVPGGVGRADARRQCPTESGHLLPDLGRARGHRPDGAVTQQEHDRQGRVPANRGGRAALRPHAGRPLACTRGRRCVHMLADLWHAPEAANTVGASAIGSSEACMLAGMAAKWRWRAKRQAEGKPADKPNMVCGPVQVVWHKFARYWDIEMREVPMSQGFYAMDPASMLERVDENTIMVVPTFGVTYTGAYEPVEALAKALDQLQAETGLDIDIHVDGASGAFLAPFCAPDVLFDFRLPRVKSISTSGHKFGLAPLGVGWVIWRDRGELPEDLVFHVSSLGGDMPVFQVNFSRPAGQVIAQYYNFLRLGFEGYKAIHDASYEVGRYLASEIVK